MIITPHESYTFVKDFATPDEQAKMIAACNDLGYFAWGCKRVYFEARSAAPGRFLTMPAWAEPMRERLTDISGGIRPNNLLIMRASFKQNLHLDARHKEMNLWFDINLAEPSTLRIKDQHIGMAPGDAVMMKQPYISTHPHQGLGFEGSKRYVAIWIQIDK